jgi:hypothetical protein
MSLRLITDKETMVTEFKCFSLANCGLRNIVSRFFNSKKNYKQLLSTLLKVWFM